MESFPVDSSLSQLVEKHLEELRRYVRRRAGPFVRSKEPVSDIVQSVLREACAEPDAARAGEDSFRAWLYTVAVHKIISKERHHAATERSLGREEPLESDLSSDEDSPGSRAEREEDLERLQAALAELDEKEREVVVLRRIFGLSAAEIAERNGEAESTVRWRLRQAMVRLAERLG